MRGDLRRPPRVFSLVVLGIVSSLLFSSVTCPPDAPLVSPLERATFLLPEWETSIRLQDNIEWVVENVEAYWDNVDIVFMMGYGRLLATENVPFHDALVSKSNGEWADKLLVYARRASSTDTDVDFLFSPLFFGLPTLRGDALFGASFSSEQNEAPPPP